MTHIVQISPTIGPGSGVAGVAFALEREFIASGATVERFTEWEAGRRRRREPRSSLGLRLAHARDVIWFTTVGTRRARRFLAQRPDAVSICHNDAMVGDIYVNHGLLEAAMRARGNYAWRMIRNPLHIFTAVRDRFRYRGTAHRAVVALTNTEAGLLLATYGRIRAPIHVIPNGVDLERFRPASTEERRRARTDVDVSDDALVALFIGHEFERKGLPLAMSALRHAPTATLVVVGGTVDEIRRATAEAIDLGVAQRVRFTGSQTDPIRFFRASDVFVLPSAYESYGLVITEALASGLPVISTAVGIAPDVIVDGVNGYVVAPEARAIGHRLEQLAEQDRVELARHARESAAALTWKQSASEYMALADSIARQREDAASAPLRILHVIRSDGFSGVEQFVLRLALQQASDGHRVAVIGGATARMRPGLAAAGIPHIPAARTDQVAWAVHRHAQEVDIINTHMTAAEVGVAAALSLRRSRRPAVVATRHFAKRRGRVGPVPIDALVRRSIRAEISISEAVAGAVERTSTVVHTGIPPRAVTDAARRKQTILIAQRLQPEKRTDVGVRAFAASGLATRGWSLEVAGNGPEREVLQALALELGIAPSVRFIGYRSDLPELMADASLLLAPCPVEGLGLTLIEAMASGLPPVAADAAGHVEVLAGLDPRCRYAPDDAEDAGRKLRALADDPAGRTALGAAARERQQQQFSLRAQADVTEAVYRGVLR